MARRSIHATGHLQVFLLMSLFFSAHKVVGAAAFLVRSPSLSRGMVVSCGDARSSSQRGVTSISPHAAKRSRSLLRACNVPTSYRSLYILPRRYVSKDDQQQRSGPPTLMMAADDDDASDTMADTKTIDGTWNIAGLKKEATRLTLRCHKKIGKAAPRLDKAVQKAEELMTDPDATLEELEACPNVDALRAELDDLRARLGKLNELEDKLRGIKKKEGVLPEEVASLALELGVNDAPPKREPRGPKRKKGPKNVAPRLPYRRFYTKDRTEIRVGKQAEDNDQLSLLPEHRDSADWWMHASGCPGSHVVIRRHDQSLEDEVVKDAAALAARQSKCTGANIKVSMVRCRDVSKPRGAKAGLVQLNGNVRTITVNMKEAEVRLGRLDKTMVMN